MKELKEEALNIINLIEVRREGYDVINKKIKELQGDFPSLVHGMDDVMEAALVSLLDKVLDDDELASYYLYECMNYTDGTNTRKVIEEDKEWPLTNIIELAAYVYRNDK